MGTTGKPQLVMVHGIGGPRKADEERREWKRALAEGAREAGYADAISALTMDWSVDTSFAYYGDLFTSGGEQQGTAVPDQDEELAHLVLAVVREFIDALAASSEHGQDTAALQRLRVQAEPELTGLDGRPLQPEGVGGSARRAAAVCAKLARLPGVQVGLQRASAVRLFGILSQPGRYLRRKEPLPGRDGQGSTLDARIRARVLDVLDPQRPAIVIGHSLGSVVAMEALAEYEGPVPLFVTLGSPLATNALVWQRLRPRPPSVPPTVGRWLDVWDGDDPVVPRRRLAELVAPSPSGVRPEPLPLSSRVLWTHPATAYLRRSEVARPVMAAIARLSPVAS
ncbi:hypothetical protein [Streptomyces sp. NPDC008317]|uniref:hypothetical protein n=1 Tax=Streptomyces sp. NPDC008317 TaxID=3364827 RepID=UPI0036E6AD5B